MPDKIDTLLAQTPTSSRVSVNVTPRSTTDDDLGANNDGSWEIRRQQRKELRERVRDTSELLF